MAGPGHRRARACFRGRGGRLPAPAHGEDPSRGGSGFARAAPLAGDCRLLAGGVVRAVRPLPHGCVFPAPPACPALCGIPDCARTSPRMPRRVARTACTFPSAIARRGRATPFFLLCDGKPRPLSPSFAPGAFLRRWSFPREITFRTLQSARRAAFAGCWKIKARRKNMGVVVRDIEVKSVLTRSNLPVADNLSTPTSAARTAANTATPPL